MNRVDDPFLSVPAGVSAEEAAVLAPVEARRTTSTDSPVPGGCAPPAVGRLHGFDLLDQPLISNISARDGELLTARTAVSLRRSMIGREVLVMFDRGDERMPVIVGVIHPDALDDHPPAVAACVVAQVDGERHVIEAEREIVLRCGEASITLTRAGKVIIQGNYILSRSTGYNKIKGAAIDIN